MENNTVPQHVAIIMDGNRRWAKKRLLPAALGHAQGVDALENALDVCIKFGIKYLTVYAFSTENWRRSQEEVDSIMKLLMKNINDFNKRIKGRKIRFQFVGDIHRLSPELQKGIRKIEEQTKDKEDLIFSVAINYGGRAEMTFVAKKIAEEVQNGSLKIDDITEETINERLQTQNIPDPDLLIRTGGEERLSGFLLWQCAYSELYFTDVLWPDFDEKEFQKAVEEYQNRKRNFGK